MDRPFVRPLDYAPPADRWSAAVVGEMLAGLAALAFVGFGLLCLLYTIVLGVVAVRVILQS